MKEHLISCVQGQMTHLDTVDTKEMGEVIDMIKDLSEAMYYCTITEAMEEKEHKGKEHYYYLEGYVPDHRGMDRNRGRMYFDEDMYYGGWRSPRYDSYDPSIMYYGGNGHSNNSSHGNGGQMNNSGSYGYTEREFPLEMRDEREGKSHMSRKTYMESKEMHQDKNIKLKDLEKYMQELSTDIVEMIQGASPEEKQLLEKRISALATKINQLNV